MLKITELEKKYHKKGPLVLSEINLELTQGERVAILGTSGAGKTTLLRCVNQIHLPTKGEIYFNGTLVNNLRGKGLSSLRRQIGMIFQNFGLVPRHSVLDNVLMGRLGYKGFWKSFFFRFSKEEIDLATEALEKVGLLEHMEKRVEQLSGGQRQRVAIARTLMQKPQIILADEPVASLDPHTARSIMEILVKLNESENITMLTSLHTVEIAKEFATRIIGMVDGRIVFDGKPCELTSEVLTEIYQGKEKAVTNNMDSIKGGVGCTQENRKIKSYCG